MNKKTFENKPIENNIEALLSIFNSGDYLNAIEMAKAFLKNNPKEYLVWNILGISLATIGKTREAIEIFKKVISLNYNFIEGYLNLGKALNTIGDFEHAIKIYNRILSINPSCTNAQFSIGDIQYNRGNYELAIESYYKVLSIQPDNVEALNNIGTSLKNLKRLSESINFYNKALALDPSYAEAYNNLGTVLYEKEDHKKALKAYNKAIKLYPKYAEAYYNKANLLKFYNKNKRAKVNFKKAISLRNNYPKAYNNLGIVFHEEKNLDEAIFNYKTALAIKRDYPEAYFNLGNALLDLEKFEEAIEMYKKSLLLRPNYFGAYVNMVFAFKNVTIKKADPSLQSYILELLESKDIVRPIEISTQTINLLKLDPTLSELLKLNKEKNSKLTLKEILNTLSDIPLLLKLMSVCPLPDLEFENLFKNLRSSILYSISEVDDNMQILPFQSALALQCYTNEYVYFEKEDDTKHLRILENKVKKVLLNGGQPKPQVILCLASFKALHENEWCDLLKINPNIKEVYIRQVVEPRKEEILKKSILEFKKITNKISTLVKKQYEASPYPRWVNLGSRQNYEPKKIVNLLDIRLYNHNINEVKNPEILIAGCGTGQQSIEAALRFPKSKVLAIDLSSSSLAYAIRKTRELNIKNIEYMQADILDMNELDSDFDIIESSGVIHHMQNPLLGWKILTRLLKVGGLMNIGLYSKIARRNIFLIRKEIAEEKISSENIAIRSFREKILSSYKKHHRDLLGMADFFSLSEVKDLLFHVQEKNFTLPFIRKSLSALNLKFCGFEDKTITKKFIKTNSNNDLYNLNKWTEFEEDNPNIFSGMYQFWCQKT